MVKGKGRWRWTVGCLSFLVRIVAPLTLSLLAVAERVPPSTFPQHSHKTKPCFNNWHLQKTVLRFLSNTKWLLHCHYQKRHRTFPTPQTLSPPSIPLPSFCLSRSTLVSLPSKQLLLLLLLTAITCSGSPSFPRATTTSLEFWTKTVTPIETPAMPTRRKKTVLKRRDGLTGKTRFWRTPSLWLALSGCFFILDSMFLSSSFFFFFFSPILILNSLNYTSYFLKYDFGATIYWQRIIQIWRYFMLNILDMVFKQVECLQSRSKTQFPC